MAKCSDLNSDDDTAPLSSEFKNLECDAPVLSGEDVGQAPSQTTYTNGVILENSKVKRRRLLKTD